MKAQFDKDAKTVKATTDVILSQKAAEITIIEAQADANAQILQAAAVANGTKIKVDAESQAFQSLSSSLDLNTSELLSYLWITAVRDHDSSNLLVNLDKPTLLDLP